MRSEVAKARFLPGFCEHRSTLARPPLELQTWGLPPVCLVPGALGAGGGGEMGVCGTVSADYFPG